MLRINRDLRELYSNEKEYLKSVMRHMVSDNDGITYEAISLLSIFVIMEDRHSSILAILKKNAGKLVGVVQDFVPKNRSEEECDEFNGFKNVLVKHLQPYNN